MKSVAVPNVSVLIAAYEAAGFIRRAIDSALEQEGVSLEILVVDDASTDGTAALVRELATGDPRIRLIGLPHNRGPSAARNAGIDAARGDWVAVLDADDAYMPGRLRRLLSVGARHSADVLADNFVYYDAGTGRSSAPALRTSPGAEAMGLRGFVARSQTNGEEPDYGLLKPMFRRRYLDENGLRYPERSRYGEDFLFMFDALAKGGRFVLDREPGYVYTSRSSGLSKTRVDYASLIRDTAGLLLRSDVAGDAELSRLLRARVAAIRRLNARSMMAARLGKGEVGGLMVDMARDHLVAESLAREGWRRVRNAVRWRARVLKAAAGWA